MSEPIVFPSGTTVAIDGSDAPLPEQATPPARATALILLCHAGPSPDNRDDALAVILRHAGFATLTLDLLSAREERFADKHHNVSLLANRLLDTLTRIKQRMLTAELPTLAIGLCAAGDCSPVVVRAAAIRDRDIYALVCRGGLIDLAGMLYLQSLSAALLVLLNADEPGIAASNQRALREVAGAKELKPLPASAEVADSTSGFESVARESAQWFVRHLPAAATRVPGGLV